MQPLAQGVPYDLNESVRVMMDLAIQELRQHEESDFHDWAHTVRAHYNSYGFQQRLAIDLNDAKDSIWDGGNGGGDDGDPPPYTLLIAEFAAFYRRQSAPAPNPSTLDHSLGIADILLDSLHNFLNGHPISAAVVSLVREMVQVAKEIARRS